MESAVLFEATANDALQRAAAAPWEDVRAGWLKIAAGWLNLASEARRRERRWAVMATNGILTRVFPAGFDPVPLVD